MKIASKPHTLHSSVAGVAIVSAVIALAAAPTNLAAQQGYQPYSYPASPNGNYGSPYAQPQVQQPQYQQPQYGYAQPQYQQPQYQQPQVQQPQYAPQQQPYAPQPYAPSPYQQPDLSQPAAPAQALSADQLEQLLAPIALYPDALLAQIFTASTYPAQVAVADQWLQQMRAQGYGSPDQIAAGAEAQGDWDPSVKALTAFPDVLDLLNHDLDWTTALGDAYYNQPQDVMQTVQVLRQRAQQAGNLADHAAGRRDDNQGYIDIAPPNPEVVYVPTYNPWDVYGAPIAPYPGFSLIGALGSFFDGIPIQYGLSFALGAFDRTPFGLLAWGLDWLAHDVLFHQSGYFTSSASVHDWGLPRGGPRAYNGAYNGWRQNARAPGGYGNTQPPLPDTAKLVSRLISAGQRVQQSRTGAELRAAARAVPRARSPRCVLVPRCTAAGVRQHASRATRTELRTPRAAKLRVSSADLPQPRADLFESGIRKSAANLQQSELRLRQPASTVLPAAELCGPARLRI